MKPLVHICHAWIILIIFQRCAWNFFPAMIMSLLGVLCEVSIEAFALLRTTNVTVVFYNYITIEQITD